MLDLDPQAGAAAYEAQQQAQPGQVLTQQPPSYVAPIEHTTLVQWFEDAEEVSTDSRAKSERDRDYVDNKQYTPKELKLFEDRGQPDIVINRVKSKHQYLMGYEETNRTNPRGFPRTPDDEEAADACSDALRYVGEKADIDQIFSQVWDNMLVEGFGGAEVSVIPRGDGIADIEFKKVHWDRSFHDPHSREHDFEDARYLGMVVWLDEDDAFDMYPQAKDIISGTIDEAGATKTYGDRPSWQQWATSGKRKRVRIVMMHYRVGPRKEWHWSLFSKGGVISEGKTPYRDEDDNSLCPLILQSGYVDRENNRYGFVRQLIGPQDELNKRRQKALHLLMNRQTKGEKGAVDDVDAMKAELSKADGHIELNPGFSESFGVIDTNSQIAGNLEMAQDAKNEIDLMGPNAALSGKQGKEASGRAVLASQQGGQIELAMLIGRHKHFKKRVYRLAWAMIRQYWTAEMWVRVTDDEKNLKFVGLNRQVTLAEDLLTKGTKDGEDVEQIKERIKQRAANDPQFAAQLGQPIRTENVPAKMSMDIILGETPDTANIQQEQFALMTDMGKAGVVQFPPQTWIKMSGLRDKAALIKEITDQKPNPVAEAETKTKLEQLLKDMEKTVAEIESIKSVTALNSAKAEQLAVDGYIQQSQLLPPLPVQGYTGGPQAMPQRPPMPQASPPMAPRPVQNRPDMPPIQPTRMFPPPQRFQ